MNDDDKSVEVLENEKKKEEESISKEEKTSQGSNALIYVLIGIMILGIIAVIVLAFAFPKDKSSLDDKKQTEETTKKDVKETEKDTVENKKEEEQKMESGVISNKKIEITTQMIKELTNSFIQYYPIEDLSKASIKNQDYLSFALSKMDRRKSFTENDIETVLKKYFGNTVKVKHENIICEVDNEPYYIYKDGVYTFNDDFPHGHEGAWGYNLFIQFDSVQFENNSMTLNYKIMYGYPVPYYFASVYYSGYKDKKVVMELKDEIGVELPNSHLLDESFQKTGITSFTYEIDSNGSYRLKSVTEK